MPHVSHKGSMNVTRFYYGLSRTPILLCMIATLFTGLSAQSYGQQSLFDRLTDVRCICGQQCEGDDGNDEDIEPERG